MRVVVALTFRVSVSLWPYICVPPLIPLTRRVCTSMLFPSSSRWDWVSVVGLAAPAWSCRLEVELEDWPESDCGSEPLCAVAGRASRMITRAATAGTRLRMAFMRPPRPLLLKLCHRRRAGTTSRQPGARKPRRMCNIMSIQSPEDLAGLQAIGRIVALALQAMAQAVRPGITTAELDEIAN